MDVTGEVPRTSNLALNVMFSVDRFFCVATLPLLDDSPHRCCSVPHR